MHSFLDIHLAKMPPGAVWVTACELDNIGASELREIVIRMLRHLSDFQQAGGVLLKSGASWHASPDYFLAQEYAAARDPASTAIIVDRLYRRVETQPNQPESRNGPDHQVPFQDLAEILQPGAPAQAQRILDLAKTTEFNAKKLPDEHLTAPTEKTAEVIQAVRNRLLKQTP